MNAPTLLDPRQPCFDIDLLRRLIGRRLSRELKVLAVVGAHRFQEVGLLDRVFPLLERIYLFEPLPGPLEALHAMAAADTRIRVFPVAVSDQDGCASFHVASNDGESSSLLEFGSHRELFPEVRMERTIDVTTRRLDSVLAEHSLPAPDLLLVDVQGAELRILGALGPALLASIRLIYTEVSTERVYAASGVLSEVEALLAPRFANLGFAPLRPDLPMHGNAVFVAREDVSAALALTPYGRLRQAVQRWQQGHRVQRLRTEPRGTDGA